MYDFIYEFILANKYLSIFAMMFFFPTESVMPIVGFVASEGKVNLWLALVIGTAGSTLGSVLVYGIGRLIRQDRLYAFIDRYGNWVGLSARSTERAGKWFDRNAVAAVLVGKFVPGIRSAVSLSAGFRRMPFSHYVGYTVLGTALNAILIAVIGYTASVHFETVAAVITNATGILAVVVVAALGLYANWRRSKR